MAISLKMAISMQMVTKLVKKIANWKATGPDRV